MYFIFYLYVLHFLLSLFFGLYTSDYYVLSYFIVFVFVLSYIQKMQQIPSTCNCLMLQTARDTDALAEGKISQEIFYWLL